MKNIEEITADMKSLRDSMEPTDTLEKNVAENFFNLQCGTLHLGWAIDRYWAKVAKEVMIPNLLNVYDALVSKGINEENKMYWGDADGDMYYIPNEKRKIIVLTTQNNNYLFIMTPFMDREYFPDAEDGKYFGKEFQSYRFHIRKFWEPYEKESIWDEEKMLSSINEAIDGVETLEKFSDDFSKYPQRPSLNMYRQIDFNLDDYQENPRFYGDCRDRGYIISLGRRGDHDIRTVHSFYQLDILSTCYIGVMARDLEIESIELNGYP